MLWWLAEQMKKRTVDGVMVPDTVCRGCDNKRKRELAAANKVAAMDAYGGACLWCGVSEYMFLTFDHIHDDGKEHCKRSDRLYRWLRDRGYPQDRDAKFAVQLLCYSCNCAKEYTQGGEAEVRAAIALRPTTDGQLTLPLPAIAGILEP
jgi:hypothetical protein